MKAFKGLLYSLLLGLILWVLFIVGAVFVIAEANADVAGQDIALTLQGGPAPLSPACEYRTASHSVEHGGLKADSAWHVAHGDLPTCNPDKDSEHKDRDRWHRDEIGFHCTWRGCG